MRSLRLHYPVGDRVTRPREGIEHDELAAGPQPRERAVSAREWRWKAGEHEAEHDGVDQTHRPPGPARAWRPAARGPPAPADSRRARRAIAGRLRAVAR